jgi:hypothetical protein
MDFNYKQICKESTVKTKWSAVSAFKYYSFITWTSNARLTRKQKAVLSGMLPNARYDELPVRMCWMCTKTLNVPDDGAGKAPKRVEMKTSVRIEI